MITLVQALNFRCLRYISQKLSSFHVLVGPNSSGKSSFLDVISFLSDLVRDGLEIAIENRTESFADLIWKANGNCFEIAVEAQLPEDIRLKQHDNSFRVIRYEIRVSQSSPTDQPAIAHERVIRKRSFTDVPDRQLHLFPSPLEPPATILRVHGTNLPKIEKASIYKQPDGNDHFYAEGSKRHLGKAPYNPSFRFGPQKAALAYAPEDDELFPASRWLRRYLIDGVKAIALNSNSMRKPSPPERHTKFFSVDGSNLPWLVGSLKESNPKSFADWLEHIRLSLPDVKDISVREMEHNKARYLLLEQSNKAGIPAWTMSDGMLRILALTLMAYFPQQGNTFLIEEPENGIHPTAIKTILDSLQSVYEGQVLTATHSPLVLKMLEPNQLLCFAKDKSGATDIIGGQDHPKLQDWQGETNLGMFFASGILG